MFSPQYNEITDIILEKKLEMLELMKIVLSKMTFDRRLFKKELLKAVQRIPQEQLQEFRAWCYDQFANKYPVALKHAFVLQPIPNKIG